MEVAWVYGVSLFTGGNTTAIFDFLLWTGVISSVAANTFKGKQQNLILLSSFEG